MNLKVGELFSGPGGLALGAKLVGKVDDHGKPYSNDSTGEEWSYVPVWANDIDPSAIATYQTNIMGCLGDKRAKVMPVDQYPIGDMEKVSPIDVLTFGFPCNDFSLVGKQKGLAGKFGHLYQYGVKVLKLYQPMAFVAENVSGLTSANKGQAFKQILKEMKDVGYHLTINLYKFEKYGVPQTRHRIIIVGIRNDLYQQGYHFHVPAPTTPLVSQYKTAYEALTEHPISSTAANNEPSRLAPKTVRRLHYIPEGENVWSVNEQLPDDLKLKVKGAKLSNIYRRLDRNKPSYTVTGSGGGGTQMYHWKQDRALTNRERARLQSFPDDFIFKGTHESVRKQVGMAVPPDGAKIIMKALLMTLAGTAYPSVYPTLNIY